jgi:hypothetical protein
MIAWPSLADVATRRANVAQARQVVPHGTKVVWVDARTSR